MTKIRTIIADDEYPARNELAFLLENINEVELLYQAENGLEALEYIKKAEPDLVFLDIQMPGKTGMEVAREIKDTKFEPVIVFVTAYDQYAVEAFAVNAVDYLLKPYEENRLSEIIKKVKKTIYNKKMKDKLEVLIDKIAGTEQKRENTGINKLAVQGKRGHLKLVKYDDIVLLHSKSSRIYAKTVDEEYEVSATLCELAEKLQGHKFLRIHRSYIINLNKVKEIIPWFKGNYQVVMNDKRETEVVVSRSKVKEIQRIFNL